MAEPGNHNGMITDHEALNRIPSGVGVYDLKDNIIEMKYLNDGYYQMIGSRREDRSCYFGNAAARAIHPEDLVKLLEEANSSVREKRLFDIRFRVLNGSGEYIWIGIRANHVPVGDRTERFFAAYYNVDALVSRQKMLETREDEMNSVIGSVPGGVAVFSCCGENIRMEYANNGFYELHHGSREYWQRMDPDPTGWLLPEDRILFWNEFSKVRDGIQKLGNAAYRIIGEDGALHWVNNQFRFAYRKGDTSYYYASFTDLDALKAAEQSKNEIRRMYESAVEEAKLVVWEYDLINHRIIMAENEFTKYDYRKFGLPKITENAPQALVPYIDDASVDVFLEMYRKIESGEPEASCEVWYKLNTAKEPRCERIFYMNVFDAAHKPVKAYGIGQNITQQKMAQAEYNRLRAQLTGNLKDIVSSTQLNITKNEFISSYSPYPGVAESLTRRTADEHFEAAASAIANEKLRREVVDEYVCSKLLSLFKNGKMQLEKTYPVRTSTGGIMWVHTVTQLMQNPGTGDVEAITYSKDITEEKRTHEIVSRLSVTSCDFIGIIDVSEKSFIIHTENWDCTDVTTGKKYDYETVRQLLAGTYIVPERKQSFLAESDLEKLAASLEEKGQSIIAYDYLDASDGSGPLKKQIVFNWLNDERREMLCIQQDVTAAYLKEQEQIAALEKAKLEADKANEAKSVFLSGMSHDLRTPLNGVLGFTSLALKENDPARKQELLQKVDTSGRLLRDLINDTLDLSRIESGKARVEAEAVMPDDLIPAVTVALKASAELKNIRYSTDFDIDTASPVWCDKLKVQKIALNLISNAIRYTPKGGTVSIALRSEKRNETASCYILTVSDTGIGMSEQFLERMYEPFAQEKRSELIMEPGTGLGLSIVKSYVDLMGGTIRVTSKVHEGTRIEVTIPYSTESRQPDQARANEAAAGTLAGRRILLCENNQMNTEIAVMLLKEQGMLVETAENGKAGLEIFSASEEGCFDAVLMDLRMPVMDGYEAARRIRKLPRKDAQLVPIIALTADAFEESIRESREAGMNAYVTKPVEPQELYSKLMQCIGGKEQ